MYSSPPLHATGAYRAVYIVAQRKILGECTLNRGSGGNGTRRKPPQVSWLAYPICCAVHGDDGYT